MKNKLLLASVLLAMPAFAGTSSTEVISSPPPQPQPSLWSWFIGGSVGYLLDAEDEMYTGHIGVDTPWNLGGWNVALFAELGYTETDEDYRRMYLPPNATTAINVGVNVETEVMPLTFNVKFERPLTGNLNAFVGGGLGVAFLDLSSSSIAPPFNYSEDDQAFCAQVFAGLVYNVNESFEVFGGARWIYIDSAEFGGVDVDSEDDFMFDLGLRFNF